MQNGPDSKIYIPVLFFFLGLSVVFFLLPYMFSITAIDFRVLKIGNLLLFLLACISFRMNVRALLHKNVQGFLRLVYGSFLLKFFVIAIAAFVYIAVYKKEVNKPALFGFFGMYIVYTFIEVRSVMKLSKKTNA